MHAVRNCLGIMIMAIAMLHSPKPLAQPDNTPYLDLLLFSQFGEFCTMCEAVLLCQKGETIPAYEQIPAEGSFTVFHLETRTFWSQVMTIWEWFIDNFKDKPISGHNRPVNIVSVNDGQWGVLQTYSLHIDIDPPLLTIENQVINRRSQAWLRNGADIGYCQRLPLWESLDIIAANATAATGKE